MNKEQLNNVFDSIAPSMEQKEKMFAEIMKAKTVSKNPTVVPFRKYAVAAAAVIAISAGAIASYNVLNGNGNKPSGALANADNRSETQADSVLADANMSAADNMDDAKSFEKIKPEVEDDLDAIASESIAMESSDESEIESSEGNSVKDAENSKNVDSVDKKEEKKSEKMPVEQENNEAGVMPYEPKKEVSDEKKEKNDDIFAVAPELSASDSMEPQESLESSDSYYYEESESSKGGGGGGGASINMEMAPSEKRLSYSEIRKNSAYSEVFPTTSVAGYSFSGAIESFGTLCAKYSNESGKTITVTVAPYANAEIIGVNEISSKKGNSSSFALDCGSYYVTYQAESVSGEEMYKMATSAPCYK